jgi:hypothetical protein
MEPCARFFDEMLKNSNLMQLVLSSTKEWCVFRLQPRAFVETMAGSGSSGSLVGLPWRYVYYPV